MKLLALVAGLAAMRAAIERGDLDEAARQGALAGPAVVAQGLAAHDRAAQLAAIAAAPAVEDAAELLPALARVAAGPDRRTAIPAARAAWSIARSVAAHDPADDLATEDLDDWRATWAKLATDHERWIEVRIAALDTAAALATPGVLGFDLGPALADPDPGFRAAAIGLIPQPVPDAVRAQVGAMVNDPDDRVALAAAQVVCADLVDRTAPPGPILAALGGTGLARIRSLVTTRGPLGPIRDAARCLSADPSPESAAALHSISDLLRR